MDNEKLPAKSFISIRVNTEQKALVMQAADNEGLQISSFIIMLLVRFKVLPDSCLARIKRRPVPLFMALHGLLGVVNKIGGNCKQLASAMPDIEGLHQTHIRIIRAAATITDTMQGKTSAEGINLYRLQADLTKEGHLFNQIVKSVNSGKPNLTTLPYILASLCRSADAVVSVLKGNVVTDSDDAAAQNNQMLAVMKKAGREHGQLFGDID